ncbi:MAG: hypothetical protein WA857_17650 [Candidatus Acidiferrum sp.]
MRGTQRLLAIAMAFAMTGIPARGKPDALGIVEQADHARLGGEAASEGTTIYDGDRLSTEAGGSVQLLIGEAKLYLAEKSSVVVHNDGGKTAREFEAELLGGSAVLSVTARSNGEIVANAARIRAISETRGVVQVRRAGLNELIVFAQRGPAEICYRGECATIPEGKSYRVLLSASDDPPPAGAGAKGSGKPGKALVLIVIGATAGGVIAATWGGTPKGVESPDHP